MDNYKRYENNPSIKKLPVKNEISCQEIKQTELANVAEIDLEDAADIESAYEDSFDSDESDEELETKVTEQFSITEIPLYRFTSTRTYTRHENAVTSSDTDTAAPKESKTDLDSTLEEKMHSLDLHGVRRIRSAIVQPHRKNMSFTNNEVMQIERDNEILLRKIMSQQKPKKGKVHATPPKLSSSAINRKRSQKKIEEDNMILLQRLQKAKSCALSTNKIPGFRVTHL